MLKNKQSFAFTVIFLAFILVVSFGKSNSVYAKEALESKANSIEKEMENAKKNGQKVTIMYYCDADNDLEANLLSDVEEMKRGYQNNPNLNLIVLVDRIEGSGNGYTNNKSVFGENFADTRLYEIKHNKANRLDGGAEFPEITCNSNYEANMGDANVLKKFINYCKANYKADKYVLIMSNHGGGAKEKLETNPNIKKAICWDYTNQLDCLYTAEISDYLTEEQSVDVLVFDACYMGTVEVAYQYRPGNGRFSADSIVASSPTVWGHGFQYDNIFNRIKSSESSSNENAVTSDGKIIYDPATITNEQLGSIFVEEQKDSTSSSIYGESQQLSFYDLSKVDAVKKSIDKLAVNLSEENKKYAIEELRGNVNNSNSVKVMHYFDEKQEVEWIEYPYFDLFDLCEKINESSNFSKSTKLFASDCMNKIDEMVIYSFSNSSEKFKAGKNGLSILLPDGQKIFDSKYGQLQHWSMQSWYNSIDTFKAELEPYGKLAWCKDGQDSRINKVGNWFELLDSWFDDSNEIDGGVNHYQW